MTEPQLLSLIPRISRLGIIHSLEHLILEQGSPARLWLGTTPIYFAADPSSVQQVLRDKVKSYTKPDLYYNAAKITLGKGLITSDSELHIQQKRLIQPHLHKQALSDISETMITSIATVMTSWKRLEGQEVDAGNLMSQLSMALITNTLFGTDVLSSHERDTVAQAVKTIVDYTATRGYLLFWPKNWPIIGERRFQEAYQVVRHAVSKVIAVCRSQEKTQENLLSMLLYAVDEDTKAQMSETQLFDEVMTLFLAGYESTSTALTWLWYLLSENPEMYQALELEIDTVLEGKPPCFHNYGDLNLCRMNFFESLRLYPPSPFVPRQAVENDTLGDFTVKAGDYVFVFFYGVHRNPQVWDEPSRYNPLRFEAEQTQDRHRFAFVPFSIGRRQCVGKDFAIMEAVFIIAMLMQHYKISVPKGQRVIPRVRATLHPAQGLNIKLTPR